jgi:hypothetical protein
MLAQPMRIVVAHGISKIKNISDAQERGYVDYKEEILPVHFAERMVWGTRGGMLLF